MVIINIQTIEMDPVDYAVAYDKKFRSALAQRLQSARLNMAILGKCLKLGSGEMGEGEAACIEKEVQLVGKYLREAKNNYEWS